MTGKGTDVAGATMPADTPTPTPAGGEDPIAWSADRLPVLVPDQRYRVIAELARGGLGRVLRAHDRRLGRTIVLKELLGASPDAIDRFLREARITARLQHPSIVPVHDAGRWPSGIPFYAMKEISGPTLEQVIDRAASVDERLGLLPVVLRAAEAMSYAHSERVIHRDLKPRNIVVGPFGETMVIDWGLAKDLSAPDDDDLEGPTAPIDLAAVASSTETQAGAVMGTPAYMPPEQARGEAVDERADVYALGAVLYHILAGVPPYAGATGDIVEHVLAGPPPTLASLGVRVDPALETILAKAMARSPDDRYPSAHQLADELRRHMAGQLVASHRYSRTELAARWIQRNRAPVAVALTMLIVLVVLASVFVRGIEGGRRDAEARRNELVLLQARSAVEHDPTAALAWLEQYPTSGADWETTRAIAVDAVDRGVARHVLGGHTGMVWRVAFSPDGTQLASASADGTVRLWDLAHGRIVRVLEGHTSEVDFVRWSPDGARLVTGSDDQTLRVWDLASGQARVLTGHTGSVVEGVFLADGELATASYDRTIRVWNLATGDSRVLASLDAAGDLNDLALSPDGRTFAACGKDRNVYLVDVATGAARALTGHTGIVRGVAWSPDGNTVASASYDKTVRLWNVATGDSRVLAGHTGRVYEVRFSPDGSALASASEDETVRLWDLAHGSEPRVLRGHQGLVSTVAWSPDGRQLASAGFDKRIRIWDVPRFESRAFAGFGADTRGVAFSSDGRTLGFTSTSGDVGVLDVASGAVRVIAHDPAGWLAFSPDGQRLGTVDVAGVPRVWDIGSGAAASFTGTCDHPLDLVFAPDSRRAVLNCGGWSMVMWPIDGGEPRTFGGYTSSIQSMRWSADGAKVGSPTGTELWVWDVASGTRTVLAGHEGWVAPGFRFSPDGTKVATGSNDQTVRVWDLATGTSIVLRGHDSGLRDVAFSPDGTMVATAGYDKTVRVWDLATGGSRVFRGHTATIHHLAWSPDGKTLASSSSADLTIRLWDVATGASRVLAGHTDAIENLAFSDDGSEILSASDDRTVRVWTAGVATTVEVPRSASEMRAWLARATTAVLDDDHIPETP